MTRVAVLVIAALHQPVYHHYIANYWTEMVRHTAAHYPNIDVFLLIENGTDREPFTEVADHVIEDPIGDFEHLVEKRFQRPGVPSILSKTVHALDVLAGDYDLFFRTNLSSMLKVPSFAAFVDCEIELGYAANWVWKDGLRADLEHWNWVGPDRSIADLSELEGYPGNTFLSGSGFFLGAAEAASLVAQRGRLRYDIADDVAVGLMMEQHRLLPGFSMIVTDDLEPTEMMDRIRRSEATHVRLQHLPLELAQALWAEMERDPLWK